MYNFLKKNLFVILFNILNFNNFFSSEDPKKFNYYIKKPLEVFKTTKEQKELQEKKNDLLIKIKALTDKASNPKESIKLEDLTLKKKASDENKIKNGGVIKMQACFDENKNEFYRNIGNEENNLDLEAAINKFSSDENAKKLIDLQMIVENLAAIGVINNDQATIDSIKIKIKNGISLIVGLGGLGVAIYGAVTK